jgi:hypothetical protein
MIKVYVNGEDKTIQTKDYNQSITGNFSSTGSIEIGYYKPISDLYFEIESSTNASETITLSYFTPSKETLSAIDETYSLKRSGFISWDRTGISSTKTTRNGHELHWYTIEFSGDFTCVINGINLVFSNDEDLKDEYPDIHLHLPKDASSFIRFHKSARDKILTDINNMNIRKTTSIYSRRRINQFDLLDLNEIRQVSKYTTLGLIFKWVSDNIDDKYLQDSNKNLSLASSLMEMPQLSLDLDDDGVKNNYQNASVLTVMTRQ